MLTILDINLLSAWIKRSLSNKNFLTIKSSLFCSVGNGTVSASNTKIPDSIIILVVSKLFACKKLKLGNSSLTIFVVSSFTDK